MFDLYQKWQNSTLIRDSGPAISEPYCTEGLAYFTEKLLWKQAL